MRCQTKSCRDRWHSQEVLLVWTESQETVADSCFVCHSLVGMPLHATQWWPNFTFYLPSKDASIHMVNEFLLLQNLSSFMFFIMSANTIIYWVYMLNENGDNPHPWHNHILILIGSVTFSQIVIHTYPCIYIHIYIYIYTCAWNHARARACVCVCVCVYNCIYDCIYSGYQLLTTFHSSSSSSLPYASIKTKMMLVVDFCLLFSMMM
jgi:hypothetical protein